MGNDIYTKLTTLYLAELSRLEDKVTYTNNLMITSGYDCSIVVEFAVCQARLDYYKKFMSDVLDYVKTFER